MPRKRFEPSYRVSLSLLLALCFSAVLFGKGFSLRLNETPALYPLVSAFVLPGNTLTIETSDPGAYEIKTPLGTSTAEKRSPGIWSWQAPIKPGLYPISVRRQSDREEVQIQAFVLVPSTRLKGEFLNGYRIGRYPRSGKGLYQAPRGFVEVTPETENALVAPHFQLKQFLCKQGGAYPKYLVLSQRLLLKLEMLLERVNERGYHVSTFHVMSGYRTPAYNHRLGNVKLSRHQFGDAADIYIEDPHTGQMMDLNRDGRVDAKDASVLYAMVLELSRARPDLFPVGGAGTYGSTKSHGPFLHVDARGFPATWGTIAHQITSKGAEIW